MTNTFYTVVFCIISFMVGSILTHERGIFGLGHRSPQYRIIVSADELGEDFPATSWLDSREELDRLSKNGSELFKKENSKSRYWVQEGYIVVPLF